MPSKKKESVTPAAAAEGDGEEDLEETLNADEANGDPEKDKKKKKKKKGGEAAADKAEVVAAAGAEDKDEDRDKDAGAEDKGTDKAASAAAPAEVEAAEGGEELSSQDQLLQLLRRSRVSEESRRHAERPHPFWDTQPVPSMGSEYSQAADSGPIDELKVPADVRDDPYCLPGQFEWCACDVDDDTVAHEIYVLLSENYVEDDDSMFRFDYSVPFLRWALKPPGFLRQWHLGVRVKGNGKLVGFISGIPANIHVYENMVKMVEINFLCVHKKLRSKRLAPVLIKEVTRRVNKEDIWQAVYTAGVVLPRPVSECRYWHRSLNPKKLIEVGFSHLGPRMTMARTIKLFKVPDKPQLPGMREMEERDVPRVFELVSAYLKKFSLHPEFEPDELAHWMLPREGVVYAYVRETDGEVTDVCSFYSLPSSILGNDKYKILKAAYSYWNVATTVPLHELMADALVFARQHDFDVFNALNVMDNEQFLKELKFGVGDGYLQYYIYNWKCPKIEPSGMGLVLL